MNFAYWHSHFAAATQGDADVFDNVLQLVEAFGGGVLATIADNVRSWVFCQEHCARRTRHTDNSALLSHRNGDLDALTEMGWHHVSHVSLGSHSRQLQWDVPGVGDDATFSIDYLWGEEEFTCTALGHTRVIENQAERHAFFRDALVEVNAHIMDGLLNAEG